jgi:hypothetical protein
MASIFNNQRVIKMLDKDNFVPGQHLVVTDSEETKHSFGIIKDM